MKTFEQILKEGVEEHDFMDVILNMTEDEIKEAVEKYANQKIKKEKEEFLESKQQKIIKTSRNFQTGTLYQLLCDRYFVNYHTDKQKLIDLVVEELNM